MHENYFTVKSCKENVDGKKIKRTQLSATRFYVKRRNLKIQEEIRWEVQVSEFARQEPKEFYVNDGNLGIYCSQSSECGTFS